jgi:hypothetical protein
MKLEHKTIINLISDYLEKNPEQRFSQVLFNLNINQFSNQENPEEIKFLLRDIYSDSDEDVIKRIKSSIE